MACELCQLDGRPVGEQLVSSRSTSGVRESKTATTAALRAKEWDQWKVFVSALGPDPTCCHWRQPATVAGQKE